ncbi:hypothetical protein Glove_551g11 [Diversispora epigaea]|uniref:Uncharacterized protein n=1 Tax=Diversispora epigaea TaxID=1348612 RepID=A0A397GE98_9GLOM|nr:hypothetical protein Glove_551g11 [Diversispora epigaea]
MSNFSNLVAHGGSKCSNEEWDEYCKMGVVGSGETPSEWKDRILPRLQYFRENNLLPSGSAKHLFHARRLIWFPNGTSYSPENGFAICHRCDQLVYVGEAKYAGGYTHRGIEKHWVTSCTAHIHISFEEFEKLKQKTESQQSFDDKIALHYYKLWMQNAIKRIKRA